MTTVTRMTSALVQPDWLNDHLCHEKLVVADCRFDLTNPKGGYADYRSGHILGARYVDLERDLSGKTSNHGGRHPLPSRSSFQKLLTSLGISSDTHVVAYDNHRFAFAARFWWLLKHAGHHKVSVLDGGYQAYCDRGFPLQRGDCEFLSPESTGQELIDWAQKRSVDIKQVFHLRHQSNLKLIDSRSPERFQGLTEPLDPVAGHIPGAINYFWKNVSTEAGWMRSPDDLKTYWANLSEQDEIIVYCGSGVTACVNLLALEVAGIQHAQLYPGSWSDWCSYDPDTQWKITLPDESNFPSQS